MRRDRRVRTPQIHTIVCLFYTLLALLLTWPLARYFSTHVPGDGIDDPSLAWNLWWIKERLVDQRTLDIFHVDWIFFPIEINLGFYTLTPLNGLLSVPLQIALNLVVASNVVLLSSFVLGGYGTFLLVRELLAWEQGVRGGRWQAAGAPRPSQFTIHNSQFTIHHSPFAPTLAGIVYAFASSKLFYASLGQFNIASSQWIPFTVLYVLRTGRHRRGRDAVLAGLFLTFQAWAELTYASFLLIFIAFYFVWIVAFGEDRSPRGSLAIRNSQLASFLLMGVIFAIGLSPFLWAMIPDLLREGDFFASGGGFADTFSADLLGYLVPTRLHPLWGDWAATLSFPNEKGQQIYVGYSALIAALIGAAWLIRSRGWRGIFWPSMSLWFVWLTLGERVRWAGDATAVPGPFALVSQLPFFSGNRYPSRYSVMVMLCVAVLVGYGIWGIRNWGWGIGRTRTRSHSPLPLLFIALFLFEHLSVPLPLSDFRVPPIYERIAAEPGDFTLLELPTGWRNGARVLGEPDVLIMMQQWYQTVHGKRRLGGNTSRNPPYKFQYFTDAPLIGDLIALMHADAPGPDGVTPYLPAAIEEEWDDLAARNRQIASDVLDFLDVRFVTLHVEKASPPLIRFVEEVLPVTPLDEWRGRDWAGAPATIRLYEVVPQRMRDLPNDAWTIALGSQRAQLHLAEGWARLGLEDRGRFTERERADLLLDLPDAEGELLLDLVDGAAPLTALSLNGQQIWRAGETPAGTSIQISIPAGAADRAVDRLSLHFAAVAPAAGALPQESNGWPIGDTGVTLPAAQPLFVESAGSDVGDFAHIYLAGVDVSRNQRGYNLAAIDPQGTVLDSATFDTHASTAESEAMAAWLRQWEPGTVIAGVVRDEASFHLTQAAVDALQSIGVRVDLREQFRASHAFVAVAGASPGSAEEAVARLQPALVAVGAPLSAPVVGGGIEQIHWRVTGNR